METERRVRETVRAETAELVSMQRRLHEAGLHGTARAVNEASQKLGWEAERVLNKLLNLPQTPRSKEARRG